jgi:hypothetical protein
MQRHISSFTKRSQILPALITISIATFHIERNNKSYKWEGTVKGSVKVIR